MRDKWSVRTERGALSVRDGLLRVRTTPRSVFSGILSQKWWRARVKRRGLFLLSVCTTAWGIQGLLSTAMSGGPDDWFSYALLAGGLACMAFAFANDVRNRNLTIPLSAVESVEQPTDGLTLRISHSESDDPETTEIEFRSEASVERAVEQLRYKGIRVSKSPRQEQPESVNAEAKKEADG